MSGFGKLLEIGLLAGSAAYAKNKRDEAAEAEERKAEEAAKAARTEVLRLEDDKERIRKDETAFRIRWQSPDGVFGEKIAGSPTMIPPGSTIFSTGSIKGGFKDYKGPSKIDDLFLDKTDGQFRTQLELEQMHGPKAAMMFAPLAGQRIDGKNHTYSTDVIRLAAGAVNNKVSGAKREVIYIVGKTRYDNEADAFDAHRKTGFNIRRVTNTVNAFGEMARDERDITGPGKNEGDEYHYVVLQNGAILKEKNKDKLLEYYPEEQIQTGKFVGSELIQQSIKAPSKTVVTEYGAEDGKTFSNGKTVIRDDEKGFSEDDIKKAAESRLLEVTGPPGGKGTTYEPKGIFKAMPTQADTAKTKGALEISKYTNPLVLPNGTIVGGLDTQDETEKIDSIYSKTLENMEIIKTGTAPTDDFGGEIPIGHQWVKKFGPSFVRTIKQQKKNLLTGELEQDNTVGISSAYILRKQGMGELLQIPGFKAYLNSIDMEGDENEALKIQTQLMIGEHPDSTAVVSREPITTENNERFGVLMSGTVIGPKYKDVIQRTIMPMLQTLTNSDEEAVNLLSSFIAKKRDPITLEPVQREDGLGSVASVNQIPLDLFSSMSTTIIVPGGDGKEPITELDMFQAFINGTGSGRYQTVLTAMSADDKKAMANKFTQALGEDTEAGIMFVRSLVDTIGPDQMKMLKNKFGFKAGAADNRARLGYKAKYDSSVRAKGVGIQALRTYIKPNGELMESSTFVSFDQTMDGLAYYGQEIGKRIRNLITNGDAGSNFGRQFLASTASRISSATGIATSTQFSTEALQTFEDKFNQIAKEAAEAQDQKTRLLATRKFHLTVLAYELAATIQGGTGGRTISDQDVQLIFSSLNQDFATTPQAQAASIQAAIAMIDEIRVQSLYLSSENVKDNAAVAIANELVGTATPLVSISMSVDDSILAMTTRLSQLNPQLQQDADIENVVTDEAILKSVNLRRSIKKLPPALTIDDAKKMPEYQEALKSMQKQQKG